MKNKKILYGLLGVGAIAGLYFWNKNKKVNNTNSNEVVVDNSKYPMECMMKYALQPKEAVMMPAEYWKKREEDWMKTNCK
jgi:hypothetical protein